MRNKKKSNTPDPELLDFIAGDIKNVKRVSEIEETAYVPTLFTSLNRATGIGGFPLRRVCMVRGPNGTGKSVFALSVAESMRRCGHVPIIFDTEHSAEKRWYESMSFGGDGTLFKMPASMDEMIDDVESMFSRIKKMRAKYPKKYGSTGLCLVIDTLTKLIPIEAIERARKDGIGRGYPLQAQWISMWLKMVVPDAYNTDSSVILVVQDRINMDKRGLYDEATKPSGGEAIKYDNSLNVHITSSTKIRSSDKKTIEGWESKYRVEKNKVDGTAYSTGTFVTSTGMGIVPSGLDLIAEAIIEGRYRDQISRTGNVVTASVGNHNVSIEGGWKSLWKLYSSDNDKFTELIGELNRTSRRDVV